MSQERSIRFSIPARTRSRRARIGLASLGALAVTGAIAVRGNSGSSAMPQSPGAASSSAAFSSAPPSSVTAVATPRAAPAPAMPAARRRISGVASGPPARGVDRSSEERARLVDAAKRNLEQLELQDPRNFLAIFDLMREEAPEREETLEKARRASHAYILARMRILERMLRRFVDDPESDHVLESDALAELDSHFKQTVDSLARDVPAMATLQDILTTTILKAPEFTEPHPEAE